MKNFVRILVLTISILMLCVPVFASSNISVQLNGKMVDFTDANGNKVESQIVNDRTMVPMRKIFEVLGAEVEWDGATRSITANTDELEIGLQIDNEIATVKEKDGNIKNIELDSAPVIINNRTLVPVRFIAESLEKKVGWDASNRAVIIIDANKFEEMFKKEASNFYDYLTTDFEVIETYEMEIELEAEIEQTYLGETQLLGANGDMELNVGEDALEVIMDFKLTGSDELIEELGSENIELEVIFDFEKCVMYIKTPLIEGYETKWIKYEFEDEEKEMLNLILEATKTQDGDVIETLVDSIVLEESLTLTSYKEIEMVMEAITKMLGNDNFKVSGTDDKTYTFNMDVYDLFEALGQDLSEEDMKKIEDEAIFGVQFEVKVEENVAKESSFSFSFGEKTSGRYAREEIMELEATGVLKSYNERVDIKIPSGKNVITMEEIKKEETSKVVTQAQFSGFASEMGGVQECVQTAMYTAKGDEAIRGNNRTNAQLYNFVARGGYENVTENGWLTSSEANDLVCTLIEREYAVEVLGVNLPNRRVETYQETNQQVSYYVTPKGKVFCWPPYEFDGKSYVTNDVTVKDEEGNELSDFKATKNRKVVIYFPNTQEVIVVRNGSKTEFEKGTLEDANIKTTTDNKTTETYASINSFDDFFNVMEKLEEDMQIAMITRQGKEMIRGNSRSNAQLYNVVARGSENVLTLDWSGDVKWLVQSDATQIPCTNINDKYAAKVLGKELPTLKVNTSKRNNEQVSFFVTPKGQVFCWPPYKYDGKCYVDGVTIVTDLEKNELTGNTATREEKVQIYFEDTNETVIISNESNVKPVEYERGMGNIDGIGVWYYKAGAIEGIDFSKYDNTATRK